MIGLLAESAETGAFTSADADALRALAGLADATLTTMLVSADLFTTWEVPVPAGPRARLLAMLDLYGVACAVAALRAAPDLSAGDLRRRLLDGSGFDVVRDRLAAVFRARADGIKAAAALALITAIAHASGDPGERERVHDAIEVVLSRPEAHLPDRRRKATTTSPFHRRRRAISSSPPTTAPARNSRTSPGCTPRWGRAITPWISPRR